MLKKLIILLLLFVPVVVAAGTLTVYVDSPASVSAGEEFEVDVYIRPADTNNPPKLFDTNVYVTASDKTKFIEFISKSSDGDVYSGADISKGGVLRKNEGSGIHLLDGKFYGWWFRGTSNNQFSVDKKEGYVLTKIKAKARDDVEVTKNELVEITVESFGSGGFVDYDADYEPVKVKTNVITSSVTVTPKAACKIKTDCKVAGQKCVQGKCTNGDPGNECVKKEDCNPPMMCVLDGKAVGFCGCTKQEECPNDFKCNVEKKQCEKKGGDGDACKLDGDCADGLLCINNICKKDACKEHKDCKGETYCDKSQNKCVDKKDPPTACKDNAECKSNNCKDGKCAPPDAGVKCTLPAKYVGKFPVWKSGDFKGCLKGDINLDNAINSLDVNLFIASYNNQDDKTKVKFPHPADLGTKKSGVLENTDVNNFIKLYNSRP